MATLALDQRIDSKKITELPFGIARIAEIPRSEIRPLPFLFHARCGQGDRSSCSDASIAPGASAEALKAKLFGKLVLQALIAQNNALDVVVSNRDVAAQFPQVIERLDNFVQSIVAYDSDCF